MDVLRSMSCGFAHVLACSAGECEVRAFAHSVVIASPASRKTFKPGDDGKSGAIAMGVYGMVVRFVSAHAQAAWRVFRAIRVMMPEM